MKVSQETCGRQIWARIPVGSPRTHRPRIQVGCQLFTSQIELLRSVGLALRYSESEVRGTTLSTVRSDHVH